MSANSETSTTSEPVEQSHESNNNILHERSAPPPKPLRQLAHPLSKGCERPKIEVRNKELYEEGRDYSDYGMVKSWPASQLIQTEDVDEQQLTLPSLVLGQSAFKLSTYASRILQSENKPLDNSVMSVVKQLLLQNSALWLAQHLTLLDLHLLKILAPSDLGLYVRSGLELITLPQGQQLCHDVLERYNCIKYFVASTILMCSKLSERCKMLELWLSVASDTYTIQGNHLGFAAIMAGLSLKQIVRLHSLWSALPSNVMQKCRNQLLPACVAMESGVDYLPLGGNISIPYIIPIVRHLLRITDTADFNLQSTGAGELAAASSDAANSNTFTNDLADLTLMMSHLDIARLLADHWPAYRDTARQLTDGLRADVDLLDVFRTEFHLRLLWGSKGALVAINERYNKFEQVLCALSNKVEPEADVQLL